MTHVNGSNWKEFVKDFGDAVGGILVGYSIAESQLGTGILGAILILLSVYLRFYDRKRVTNGTTIQNPG
jgi:hypothetical protein